MQPPVLMLKLDGLSAALCYEMLWCFGMHCARTYDALPIGSHGPCAKDCRDDSFTCSSTVHLREAPAPNITAGGRFCSIFFSFRVIVFQNGLRMCVCVFADIDSCQKVFGEQLEVYVCCPHGLRSSWDQQTCIWQLHPSTDCCISFCLLPKSA